MKLTDLRGILQYIPRFREEMFLRVFLFAALLLLCGCRSFPPGAERGLNGTMAYYVPLVCSDDGAKVEVLNGLTEKEQVILAGKLTLADGAPVTVVEGK